MFKKIKYNIAAALFVLMATLIAPLTIFAEQEEPVIKDPNLDQAIRLELKKFTGDITKDDLQELISLYPKDRSKKISSLEGLQYANNLTGLYLPGLGITDISPISGLNRLGVLGLNNNNIENIEPLRGLKSLRQLVISENKITNIDALSGLTQLTDLLIGNNSISDLSALKDLHLKWLIISGNQVSSIEPLRNNSSLEHLYFNNNNVSDISVLESLPNLKEVALENNPLNEDAKQIIEHLKEKGVAIRELSKEKDAANKPKPIQVVLNAETVAFDVEPFIKDGSTLVQLRPIFEKLGLKLTWDQDTKTVTGEKDGTAIKLQIDSLTAEINGKQVQLDAAPTIVDGNTFVPLRFIGESLDGKVEWDQNSKTAVIKTKQIFKTSDGKAQITAFGKWTQLSSANDAVKLYLRSDEYSLFNISSLEKNAFDEKADLEQIYKSSKDTITSLDAVKVIEEKNVTFQDHPAKQLTFFLNRDGFNYYIWNAVFFKAEDSFYQITYGTLEENAKGSQEELQSILDSFKLLNAR